MIKNKKSMFRVVINMLKSGSFQAINTLERPKKKKRKKKDQKNLK
jgi:hypothetical protein